MEEVRARVFISCGQREGEERAIADRIAAQLIELGFEPYVAVQEQTLKGLRENIFWRLEHSEYYLFIDFKREQLANRPDCRGSLFSHQELAIASFLDMHVIVLQEKGVIAEDGLMKYAQTNPEIFVDREDLPAIVSRRVAVAGWETGWRNELVLELCDPLFIDAEQEWEGNTIRNRFFHLQVKNLHRRKPALDCVATVGAIVRGLAPRRLRTVELHWAGSSVPQALIPPNGCREVDLGYVPHGMPKVFVFNSFSTSTQYLEPLFEGAWHVDYVVASATFPPVHFGARVVVGQDIGSFVLEEEPPPGKP